MFCQNCGKEVAEGSKFCPECGANIKATLKTTLPRVEEFSASEVILSEMLANALVRVGNSNTVKVTLKGDEKTKQNAHLEQSGSALIISAPVPFVEGGRQSGFNGSVVMSGIMSVTSMYDEQLMVNGQIVDMKRAITVEVEVPKGTTVKVGKLVGNCTIGDTEGYLQVNLSVTTKVLAGKVRNVHLKVSGSGKIAIAEVMNDSSINADVRGAGYITINRGKATSFNATARGVGEITFNGNADTAKMSVIGSGKITFNGSAGTADMEASGSGEITFNGSAGTADMEASGSGKIYLAECKSAPHKSKSGAGSIRVGRAPKSEGFGFDNW